MVKESKPKITPFKFKDIEDVRIIIKAKGKNWAIIPNENHSKENCKKVRINLAQTALQYHDIVSTPLEDIREKLKQQD